MRCCIRKLLTILLLLVSFSASSEIAFKKIEWESIDNNLNTIELNLKQLQTENNSLQLQLTNVSTMLQEQVKYSANQSLQLENLESKYKQLEKTTKLWKIGCCSFMTTTAIATIILIVRR